MGLRTEPPGTAAPVHVATVDRRAAAAFAAATNDRTAAGGDPAPPLFAAVAAWPALAGAAGEALEAADLPWVVHAAHDLHLHRPLAAGLRLATAGRLAASRPGRTGARHVLHLHSADAGGGPVADQYATLVVRGRPAAPHRGGGVPAHPFPAAARARRLGRHTAAVDADQAGRYAAASGDHNPIHLDDEAARRVGLPGAVLHGLCTMAIVGQSVLQVAGEADAARLARLAVRFAGVVLPGSELVTTVFDAGPAPVGRRVALAFEAHSDGRLVVAHGRAELR